MTKQEAIKNHRASPNVTWQEQAKLARQIANLPEKED